MVGRVTTIADGGYRGTGLVIAHRRAPGEELEAWKKQHNASHRRFRARVEHAFARMKTWKILRDCRLKGEGIHHAMLGIAHLHNLARRA
ncbi:transposase [Streptomyces hirsutus]